jgi:hypothetical protein
LFSSTQNERGAALEKGKKCLGGNSSGYRMNSIHAGKTDEVKEKQ